MKFKITSLAILISNVICSQTTNTLLRNDAGLPTTTTTTTTTSGFYEAVNPVNFPSGASDWWHLLDVRHSNSENNFGMQLASSFFNQELWFRNTNNSPTTSWSKVLL